jgi:hypothetical protein
VLCLGIAWMAPGSRAAIVFDVGVGANPAALQPTVDAYRTLIGGGSVAGANGLFGGVRREVNWDGVPESFSDPSLMPATFFVNTSPRGLGLQSAPGAGVSGFRVSSNTGPGNDLFEQHDGAAEGNGTYNFQAFSSPRLFTPIGGHDFDVVFFTPGTGFASPSFVTAFGAVFVDNISSTFPDCASIQLFNGATSLGFRCATPTTEGGLSFLGFHTTAGEQVTSVRIHLGNSTFGTAQDATHEVVVLDDFIYNEPGRTVLGDAAPEPGVWWLTTGGLLGLAATRRRMRS